MVNNATIDFIIPIYNTPSSALDSCIKSITKLKNIQYRIFLIDDGSDQVDEYSICTKYINQYPQKIKYFYKKNGGVSSARNYGIKKSASDYICFVDSDDLVLDIVPKLPDEFDILNYNVCFSTGSKEKIFRLNLPEGKILASDYFEILLKNSIWNSVCGKIFKKDFLKKNHIRFNENIIHGEDLDFLMQCLFAKAGIFYVNKEMYLYRFAKESENNRFNNFPLNILRDYIHNYNAKIKYIDETYALENPKRKKMKIYLNNDMIKSLFNLYLSNIMGNKQKVHKLEYTIQVFFDKSNMYDEATSINKVRYRLVYINNNILIKLIAILQRLYIRIK